MSEPEAEESSLNDAAGSLSRSERGNLHSEALTVLRQMIIEGELELGRRIPEAALCKTLGISRTPFREAIRILSSEGLVTLQPRRGAVVATPSKEEFRGLFIAIGAIEGACAALACDFLTVADVDAINGRHQELIRARTERDQRAYFHANQAIHNLIVAGARNSFLTSLHASLNLRVSRVRFFVDTPPDAWRRAIDEHVEIMAALEARDGERLSRVLVAHMRHSSDDFEKLFDDSLLQSPPPGRGHRAWNSSSPTSRSDQD